MGLLACSIPPGANTCLLNHQPKAQNRFFCPQLEAGRVLAKQLPHMQRLQCPRVSEEWMGLLSALQLAGCAEHRAGVGLRAVVQQDTLREEADLRALQECHTRRGCQIAIGFILCAQQHLLFSPRKTEETKEKYIECYLKMNQLYKPKSFSPCHAVGGSCRLAGAVCHRLQHSTQPLLPPTPTWGLPEGAWHPACIRAES